MEHPNPDDRSRDRRFADVRHLFERWARLGEPVREAAAPDGPPAAPGAPRDRPGERWPEVLQERFLAGLVAGEDLGRRAERQSQAVARQREYEREVWLDGQEYPCRLQADFASHERILGRDVLNRMDVLFRGPAGEVVVDP